MRSDDLSAIFVQLSLLAAIGHRSVAQVLDVRSDGDGVRGRVIFSDGTAGAWVVRGGRFRYVSDDDPLLGSPRS